MPLPLYKIQSPLPAIPHPTPINFNAPAHHPGVLNSFVLDFAPPQRSGHSGCEFDARASHCNVNAAPRINKATVLHTDNS